jgi:hypothetical protein
MAARDASDVISKNNYRTRYINYYVKKQNKVGAIINIVGGSGGNIIFAGSKPRKKCGIVLSITCFLLPYSAAILTFE